MQYIEPGDDTGMYTLGQSTDSYKQGTVEHTFEDIAFVKTTSYELDKNGRRKKSGKVVKVTTALPLDQVIIAKLNEECQARVPQSESD